SLSALAVAFANPTCGQHQEMPDSKSERVLLSPMAFPNLPRTLLQDLQRRGCTIPPAPKHKNLHNAIPGEFCTSGQTDWTVVWFKDNWSPLLVCCNGSEQTPAKISKWSERAQPYIFAGYLVAADKKYILERYRTNGGPKPPPINHQGIG